MVEAGLGLQRTLHLGFWALRPGGFGIPSPGSAGRGKGRGVAGRGWGTYPGVTMGLSGASPMLGGELSPLPRCWAGAGSLAFCLPSSSFPIAGQGGVLQGLSLGALAPALGAEGACLAGPLPRRPVPAGVPVGALQSPRAWPGPELSLQPAPDPLQGEAPAQEGASRAASPGHHGVWGWPQSGPAGRLGAPLPGLLQCQSRAPWRAPLAPASSPVTLFQEHQQ